MSSGHSSFTLVVLNALMVALGMNFVGVSEGLGHIEAPICLFRVHKKVESYARCERTRIRTVFKFRVE